MLEQVQYALHSNYLIVCTDVSFFLGVTLRRLSQSWIGSKCRGVHVAGVEISGGSGTVIQTACARGEDFVNQKFQSLALSTC